MASLLFWPPFCSTLTSSIARFPVPRARISASLSPPRRVWPRYLNSMSQPEGSVSLPSQDEGGAKMENSDVIVQYVVLRRDLIDTWPLGSVVTQGCHASVCVIWSHKDDPHTLEYCSSQNIDSMHKVRSLILLLSSVPCISHLLLQFSIVGHLFIIFLTLKFQRIGPT